MTDLAKAIAFAEHCLGWTKVYADHKPPRDTFICDGGGSDRAFHLDSVYRLSSVLQEFLGKRYFIQINRGTTSLFQWRVIVGWQDGTDKSKPLENAVGVGEDLWDALFDACVQAAGMSEAKG